MSAIDSRISDADKILRKRWLFVTFIRYLIYPFLLFAFFAILSEKIHIQEDFLYTLLGAAFSGLIPLWMIWHCAYRKYGISLISCWLILSPFTMLYSIIALFREWSSVLMVICTIDIAIFAWWYCLSLKMRKINKSLLIPAQKPPNPKIEDIAAR